MTPQRRRGRIIASVTVVLAMGGGAAGAWMTFGRNGDQEAIIATMGAFQAAITAGDVGAVTAQMCAEEAKLLDGLTLAPGTPPPDDDAAGEESAGIDDIEVRGGAAAATATHAPGADTKVYFRKEGEQWKVCSFAKADFESPQ